MATTDATPNPGRLQEALDPEFLPAIVQNLLQRLLEHELTQHKRSPTSPRLPGRASATATNPDASIPASAASNYSAPKMEMAGSGRSDKYQPNEKALVLSLMEM